MNLRPVGWCVILYAFMNSYYGVGASKFVIAGRDLPFSGLLPGVIYGLSWTVYFIAGTGLVLRKSWSLPLMICASAGALVTTSYSAHSYMFGHGSDPKYIFQIVRPIPEIFILGSMISLRRGGFRVEGDTRPAINNPTSFIRTTLAVGGALPWLAGLFSYMINGNDSVIKIFAGKGIFIALFMTLWFAIPFIILALIAKAASENGGFNRYKALLSGALAGAALAGVYVFWIMWWPVFNSFVMPISPPMIFAGAVSGVVAGWIISRAVSNNT
ncbi:MAG: hypothetical protein HZB33_05590 [Nitrospirae bacterium]|nr:hypothetical protein [Nitrospirota bacterium]